MHQPLTQAPDEDAEVIDTEDGPVAQPPHWRGRMVKRVLLIFGLIFLVLIGWLALTAPLSRSLEPIAAPSLTILSAEGEPIARRGAIIGEPVDVEQLPHHVAQAFVATEDRRFYEHLGVDPYGIARAALRNLRAGRVREGGSTINQQLARTSFLSPEQTAGRKIQEALIAVWLELWLSKDEVLGRYLSNVYFGDNVYGLRAAAHHYFSREPEELTVAQAAMLAGLVNAPSRLAPTRNLEGAQERAELVIRRMVSAGFLSPEEAAGVRPARLRVAESDDVPTGTYFADWVLPQASEMSDERYGQREVVTTLEGDLQRLAVRTVRRAGLGGAQAALVAMRLDGRVVAMVGGKNYSDSAFNRATQARRQPGSAFKLFTYLAALRNGYTPRTAVMDTPLRMGDWEPKNYAGTYRGRITLREAAAWSSNVGAVRLQERVGRDQVIRAARDLGITSPLRPIPTLTLGTEGVSLLELTAAYAAVASGRYPVRPHGLPRQNRGLFGWWSDDDNTRGDPAFPMLRDLLWNVANRGTGRAAALSIPTFGKTGTTQDYRDAVFIGFAGDLVVGVWIGNDDNSPLPGIAGGGLPARLWRTFMAEALDVEAGAAPAADSTPLSRADRAPAPPPAQSEPAQSDAGEPVDTPSAPPIQPQPIDPAALPPPELGPPAAVPQ